MNTIKACILLLLMAVGTMPASAYATDVLECEAGAQMVYATEGNMPGAGIHFKTHYLDSWRTGVSGNYFFKKDGVSCYDFNIEENYIFNVGEKIQLYPLVGGSAIIWHADDVNTSGWNFGKSDKTHYELGISVGGGIDYLMGERWLLNAEVKYQFIKKANQVLIGVGIGYRF